MLKNTTSLSKTVKSVALAVCSACLLPVLAQSAQAATIYWTDWTSATPGTAGSAEGSITTPDNPPVGITYDGEIFFAQTDGGINYWTPPTAFTGGNIDNAPANSDIIAVVGGNDSLHTITFDQPVENPVMAVYSLGRVGNSITYNFDAEFDVINFFPGSANNQFLTELSDNVLEGEEGKGIIQFQGNFSSINWTVPEGEGWHGFTIGVQNVANNNTTINNNVDVPEPQDILGLLLIGGFGITGILKGKRQNIA